MIKQKTLNMVNGNGYVITLDPKEGFSKVIAKSTVTCWVKTVATARNGVAPSVPTDPTPASGASTDYYRMLANEVINFGFEAMKGGDDSFVDTIQYLLVWCDGGNGLFTTVSH